MKAASDPKDIQEFQFKQSNTSQILDAFTSTPTACSLLAADKRRGLLYAGQNNKIIILKPGEDSDPEWKIEFNVPLVVSKLTLNCDCTYLAVAHGPMVLIYDAEALTKNSLQLLHKVKISTLSGDILVYDLRWNPAVPRMLCTIASDYTIGSFKIKEKKKATTEPDTFELKEKLNNEHINALCAAWSPKGKQIVVGCKNGSIVQLKPDLKIARTIPGPNPYIGEVISILWVSNYQFCAAYLGNEQGINVLVIDAPKGETNAVFTYYEDITYGITDSEAEGTIPRYYFDHVPEWGLIIAASSNSSEIAILGSTDKGVTWNQWQLVDSGRAELPLIHTTESYPVGLAIDKSPVRKLPWGADSTLPHPVPILHILATSGQLCSFHMVNLSPKCPSINSPPTEIIAIPPQTQSNISLEKSLIMNGAATSTPLVKQPENTLERSKPLSAGNILNKFIQKSSFTLPPTEKPQQEQKPEQISMGMKLEPTREIQPTQEIAKPDIKLTSIRETIMQESVEPKPFVDDDAKDNHAYIEEHNLFEKELRKRLEPQTLEYDTEEERQKLVDTSIVIDQFLRELKETTNSLSSDIAYLKALLLQSFAWVEETKSKNAATNDFATRNCGDNNKMSDLQKLYYYTQTQLTQASKILDLEWSNHKSRETSRMKIPHLEFLYQNLILHSKIIQEEKSRMEHLKKRWKLITRNNSIFGLNHSLSNLTIASSKYSTILPRNTGIIEARCKAIASKTLNFTQEKQIKLREHLSASTPRIIRPVSSSNIQDRLEETLSSLTSPNTTSINIKNKVDQSVSKQNTITKQQNTYIDPLDSMASIVAGIGTSECTSESNNVSIQNKIQSKQPSFGITFPISGNKPVQAEKISSIPTTTGVPQSTKAKQDTITLNQMQLHVPAHTSSNLIKAFPKVDTTTFDTSVQKLEETAAQNPAIQSMWLHTIKTENNLFNGSSLKDALPPETSLEKIQTTPNAGVTLPVTTAVKTKAVSTFSFATPITIPAPIKSTTQSTFVVSQTTNAQTISFASKSSNVITPFNLKMTSPATKSQTQDVLSLTGSFIGLQTSNQAPSISTNNSPSTDGKYNCKATFGRSDVNQILSPNESQISAQHNSVTIVEVPHTEATTSSLPTSAVQDLLASSATPLFNILNNTSNVSVFEEMSNSTPTTSSMPLFGGFFTTSSTTANTTTTTSATISPFQSTLSRPFEKGPIMLPTASSANAPTTTTTTSTTTTTTATATTTTTTATTTTATTTATTSTTTASTTTTTTTAITTTTVSTATTSTPTTTIAAAAVAAAAATTITTIITATTTTTTTIITATTTATLPTLTFGTVATSTVAPVFGKPSLTMNSQFPSTPVVPPTDNTFGKPATTTPLFKPFENAQSTFMFGKTTKVLTNVSIFSGTNTNSIFGGNTQVSSSGSIFGGNTSSINTFGTPQTFVFDNNAQKSDSIFGSTSNTGSTSFFGGATNNVTPALSSAGSPSVFGGTAANTSPMGVEQLVLGAQPNAFGQTPSFNAKPIFGSAPTFGAPKPVFGTGFATTAFGVNTSPPAFGNPPTMGGSPAPIDNNMPKVFGNVSGGSSTFETLASQSGGLSFSSLAQKTTDVPKSPVFTSGSSFSTWR